MSGEPLYKNENSSDSESEREDQQRPGGPGLSLDLDLGDDCVHKVKGIRLELQGDSGINTSESTNSTTRDLNPRRDDNPFSFKHFLRDSANSNKSYQSLGARPKVYSENRPKNDSPPENIKKPVQNTRNNEFSSALPDFVQDHLIMEQCYLGKRTCPSPEYDLDLPDFTPTNNTNGISNPRTSPTGEPIPLDLPGLPMRNAFPLDLPISANISVESPRPSSLSEVGNSQSLPDFLTDGPVRPGHEPVPFSPPEPQGIRPEICRRCLELRGELAAARQRISLVQDEVDKNHRRAAVAENNVHRLKQEMKSLKEQMNQLRSENQVLKLNEGAVGGHSSWNSQVDLSSNRLAQELRTAASTAEHSLRQLLTGVDNLRMMASTLENMTRIEEKSERFPNFEDNAGPAL